MNGELANRLTMDLSALAGVTAAVVTSPQGQVLGAAGHQRPAQAAALSAFLAGRAEAGTAGGDLRGLGRVLADSHLEEISFAGQQGEGIVLVAPEWSLFATFDRGTSTDMIRPLLRQAIRRYDPAFH